LTVFQYQEKQMGIVTIIRHASFFLASETRIIS
jgi:hypothetical protein